MQRILPKQQNTALAIARFANLLLAALLAGNNVGTAFGIYPALRSLPAQYSVEVFQGITRRYRWVMPFLMPATIVSCVALLRLLSSQNSASYRFTLGGLAAFLGVIAVTARELPLNFKTLHASAAAPPEDWQSLRTRWAQFNLLRAFLAITGFILLLLGTLSSDRRL